jgi:hypothetical protein
MVPCWVLVHTTPWSPSRDCDLGGVHGALLPHQSLSFVVKFCGQKTIKNA